MSRAPLTLLLLIGLPHAAALRLALQRVSPRAPRIVAVEEGAETQEGSKSLEEKMAAWEATEEEQRKATLGGIIPGKLPGPPGRATRTDQPDKMDGFDVGMNISGIILFPLAVVIATCPFWIGGLDVSSFGPPPTS